MCLMYSSVLLTLEIGAQSVCGLKMRIFKYQYSKSGTFLINIVKANA